MGATAKVLDFMAGYAQRAGPQEYDADPDAPVIDLGELKELDAQVDEDRVPLSRGDLLVRLMNRANDIADDLMNSGYDDHNDRSRFNKLIAASNMLCKIVNMVYPILKKDRALLTGRMWNTKTVRLSSSIAAYISPKHRVKVAEIIQKELIKGLPNTRDFSEARVMIGVHKKEYKGD